MPNNHDNTQRRKAGLTPARKALLEERLQKARSAGKKPASIPARVRSNFAPLSYAQEGLWVLSQFDLQSGLFNRPVILRLKGRLDAPALNGALQALLRRHESLRCRFRSDLGQPLQQVEAAVELDLGLIDLTRLEGGNRERQAHEFIRAEISKPVNLARSPLLRAHLIRLSQEDHILLMVFHHIAFDAWSERVVLADLGAFYEAYAQGKPAALDPLPVQYAEIAAWQRERVNGDVLAGQLDYWKQKLADLPTATEFPTDHPRPAISSDQGEAVDFILAEDLLWDLRQLAQSEGATLSMVLLSAFIVLLSRYTRQTEIVIGLPVAGRTLLESEGLVGLFINTLVLRCNLPADPTFREVLRLVRQESLEATSNSEIPLEKLVEVVPVKRDLSRTPFFQILFNFENLPSHRLNFPGLEIDFVASHKEFVRYDLSLELANGDRSLEGSFVFNCELYERTTIERLVESYQALLADIAYTPERPVAGLNLLGNESRELILNAWNQPEVVHPSWTSLQQAFSMQAERTPQKIAIKFKDRSLTYAELENRSRRLAGCLLQLGVPPQALIGIHMHSSPEMITGMLAALKIGAAFLILDPLQPETRLAAQIDAGQVAWILTDLRHAGGISERRVRRILIDADWSHISGLEPASAADTSKLDELAYVIFTSGSTGNPKGVMVPQRALLNHTSWARRAFQLGGSDIILQATSLSFDPFLAEIFDSLLSGSTLVLVEPEKQHDPAGLIELIEKNGVTLIDLTPSFLKLLVESPRFQDCTSLRHVRCGGEVLPVGLSVSFRSQSGAVLHNLYGPAEACIDATHYVCGEIEPGSPVPVGIPVGTPIGKPIDGMRTYILDSFLQPVPVGVTGDLYLSGEGLARGYLDQPEWTAEHFLPHPFIAGERIYRTGDQACYLADGNIRFAGRKDRQVKLRGVRIELGDIEGVLLSHPKISQSVVEVYAAEAEGEHQLVAYLVTAGGDALDRDELQSFLQTRLPKMMVPGKIMVLDELPLLPGGKIDRSALPPPAWTHPRSEASNLPSTDLEKLVARVWTEVIQVPNINLSSDFFEIGGHSLLAIRVIARLNDLLGIEIPFNIFYEAPRLVDFTRRLAVEREEDSGMESRSELILRLLEASEPDVPQKRHESAEKLPQPGALAAKLMDSGSTLEFILWLRKRQIHVWVEGDKLKYSAPPGTITPALRADLKLRKDELITFLLKAGSPDRIDRTDGQGRIPLSFAQQRLFIVQQLDPKSFAYNLASSYRMRGNLRVELLEQAVLEVLRRHSALRTNFRLMDGSAVQFIRSGPENPFLHSI